MTLKERYQRYENWRDSLPDCLAVILYAWERFGVGCLCLFLPILIARLLVSVAWGWL